MFIALRDLAYARGRFLLMGLVIALVAYLMTLLSGLAAGLVKNNISGLMSLPATHVAFEYDDRPNYRNSMVDREMWEGWAGQPGVRAMHPLGHTLFSGRSNRDEPLELVLWGISPGTFLEPEVYEGQKLGTLDNGVIISRLLADKGVGIGDTITLDRVLTELEVVGIAAEANIGHVPIVYAHLPKWQEATYGPPGGPPPGETLPAILFDYASVIALQLDEGVDIENIDIDYGTVTRDKQGSFEASTGYVEELFSVVMIQGFLIVISAVVIGAFFSIWTIQRTREIGLVKALGASNGYLIRDALGQATILLIGATAVGLTAGLISGRIFERSGNPFMFQPDTVSMAVALLMLGGLAGAALSIRRIASVDPIIALGRER